MPPFAASNRQAETLSLFPFRPWRGTGWNKPVNKIASMKRLFSRLIVLALAPLALASALAQNWHLVWSDEFNGPANSLPSESDWNFVRGWGPRGNHEIQFYCRPNRQRRPLRQQDPSQSRRRRQRPPRPHRHPLRPALVLRPPQHRGQTHHPLRPCRSPPPHGARRRLLARLLAPR